MKCFIQREQVNRLENMQQSRKVKFMKKKILLILSMCLIMLGLTACGEDPTKVDYNGFTYDQLKGSCENTVDILQSMSESEKAACLASNDETMVNLITRWEEAQEDVGAYVELGEIKITKSGKTLTLNLGYSHPVEMTDPEGVESVVEGQNIIIVKGIDKEKVGQFAAEIRDKRRPEPYKGKGIKYADETIRRKVGKTGKK